MLEIYTDKLSYTKNECVNIYINNSNPDFNVEISIINFNNIVIYKSNCTAETQISNINCFAEGCNWNINKKVNLDFNFDDNIPNIYFIKITNSNNEFAFSPFIINRYLHKKVVICNTNTWNAYNLYGGASFYKNTLSDYKSKYLEVNKNNKAGSIVNSFKRPLISFTNSIYNILNNEEMEKEHLIYGESILWKFLYENNYKFDLIIDSDVENINNIINRNIIFLNCHPEYWSHKMFYNLNKTVKKGSNLIYLGGNGIWRKIILKEDRIEKLGYPFCNKNLNIYQNVLSDDLFAKNKPLDIEPYNLLGMFYDNRNDSKNYYSYKCMLDHPIFVNTGIKKDEIFGTEYIKLKPSGHESDKINHKYLKNEDNIDRPLLAKGLNKFEDGGEITIFNIYNSKVFSCGSIPFTRCLIDEKVKNMIINVIENFSIC